MRTALVAFAALAVSQPVLAQDAAPEDDWNLTQRPDQKLTMATTVFDNGVAIAVRCEAGNFDVLLAGLPPAEGQTRRLRVGLSGDELYDQSWAGTDDPTVWFSDFPDGICPARARRRRLERHRAWRERPAQSTVCSDPADIRRSRRYGAHSLRPAFG